MSVTRNTRWMTVSPINNKCISVHATWSKVIEHVYIYIYIHEMLHYRLLIDTFNLSNVSASSLVRDSRWNKCFENKVLRDAIKKKNFLFFFARVGYLIIFHEKRWSSSWQFLFNRMGAEITRWSVIMQRDCSISTHGKINLSTRPLICILPVRQQARWRTLTFIKVCHTLRHTETSRI